MKTNVIAESTSSIWNNCGRQYYVKVELYISTFRDANISVSMYERFVGKRKWFYKVTKPNDLSEYNEVEGFREHASEAYEDIINKLSCANPFQ